MATPLDSNIQVEKKILDRFNKNIRSTQDDLFQLILEVLLEFDIKDGQFVPSSAYSRIINTINKRVAKLIADSTIESSIASFLDDFSLLDKNIVAIQRELNDISVSEALLSGQKKYIADIVLNNLVQGNIDTRFISPVKKILYQRAVYGGSVTNTEKQLRKLIKGDGKQLGVLERWAGQVARDAMNQYEGAVNQQIKVTHNLNAILYVGPLVEDSRCQCRKWVAMRTILDSQLQDEIDWALSDRQFELADGEICRPSGMIPETTVDNFLINRGGYNCIHRAIPTLIKTQNAS